MRDEYQFRGATRVQTLHAHYPTMRGITIQRRQPMSLPQSISGWGKWRQLRDRAREQPGVWILAEGKNAEHRAGNLRRHLHTYWGLDASIRRTGDESWQVWARWPVGAAS